MFGSRDFPTLKLISAVNVPCAIERARSIAQSKVSYSEQCKFNAIFHFKVGKFQEPNICAF